ncbi:MAG TPA: transcriptional regulator [Gammaproteobacteria bacterium]|nr:transcriptional regulator [Gammaproteobacteria bacterium]
MSQPPDRPSNSRPSNTTNKSITKTHAITEPSAGTPFRSPCPIARALDILGDKWTLLVMRDALYFNVRTYADFASQIEHIPTNLLASRLKTLTKQGFLEKVPYQTNPMRYEYVPTDLAKALKPLLREVRKFGEAYFTDA